MKDWNPQYRFRAITLTNGLTNNVAEFVIELESVVHRMFGSVVFNTFAGTRGAVAAGFNLADANNIANVDPDNASNAIMAFSSGLDLATPLTTQYQQGIDLDHMVVPAGTRFQVVFAPTGGLVTMRSHWSLAFNPLTEWQRWHGSNLINRLPSR